ncbi:hypothetical protein NDU88_000971 [Pleurodeles waltl]|uniref:Uncharacterized protein n=1 Tax=Pleurodeles waltl TaxID=8319 RepID=A0AAV7N9H7_PLEWA|nr:hypothetical protein NDU88_000971 [Pleurodeles waltl]
MLGDVQGLMSSEAVMQSFSFVIEPAINGRCEELAPGKALNRPILKPMHLYHNEPSISQFFRFSNDECLIFQHNDNDNSLCLLETSYSQAKIIGLVTQAPPHSTRKTLSPSLLLLAPLAQLQGLPSRNAETGDPKLTLPGSQSVARRREERILTLASLSFKPSPGWGPGAQTHADPAVKATAAFPSLTRPDSQTGAQRRDEETPHPRPFILQAVVRGGGQGGQTNVDPTGRNLCCFPEQRPREGLLTMQDARFRRHIRPTGVHGSSLADRHVPR